MLHFMKFKRKNNYRVVFSLFFELELKSVLRSPMPRFSQKKAFFFYFLKNASLIFPEM